MIETGQGYDSRKEVEPGADTVTFWLDAIALSEKEENDWRREARNVISVYRGEKAQDSSYNNDLDFNILHANVETILPAIYNSPPSPDIRRRFGDKDATARVISQLLERCLSFYQDAYDYDSMMNGVLFDGAVAGRGIARVRYVPTMQDGEPVDGDDPSMGGYKRETVESESVACEYVNWQRFRVGKADTWEEMPWIAFEHFLSKDELKKITTPDVIKDMSFDYSVKGNKDDAQETPDIYRRARVWEIWDKESRKVFFISAGHGEKPLAVQDDPLGLEAFFPVPRPVMPVYTPGRLTPVCPYSIYRKLAEELNAISRRIKQIVQQIRVKGAYAIGQSDLSRLADADDGELIGVEGLEMLIEGGIEKGIAWWPIEPAVKALQQLYQQREQLKQTIYEVTGISDIVRGQSAASETATAQQIKTQWGSLRIQKLQNDVQRFARDLYRIKAEIISNHFSIDTMMEVTGIKLLRQQEKQMIQMQMQQQQPPPPQPGQPPQQPPQQPQLPPEIAKAMKEPSVEEVEQVIRSDMLRAYRVDVESDSTIRSDMTRQQKAMQEFLQGTSQYLAAAGPVVQSGMMPPGPLIEVYAAFARMFKLGKQADDALDQLSETAKENPPPPKPDPEAEKAKAQMAMEKEKAQASQQLEQAKLQMQQQGEQAKLQMEQQKMAMDAEATQAKGQQDAMLAREKMYADIELQREKMAFEQEMAREKLAGEMEIKRIIAQEQAMLASEAAEHKAEIAEKDAETRRKSKSKADA